MSWLTRNLSELVTLQRGHDLPESHRAADGQIPVVGSSGITGVHDVARYPGPGVAIGRSGASIGVATYVKEPYWPLNTCLFVTDFKGNDPRWVYWMLKGIDFVGFNSGSAQPSLNRNYLAGIPVYVPPRDVQAAIAEVLGALDDKIAANENLLSSMQSTMKAIASTSSAIVRVGDISIRGSKSVNPRTVDGEVEHFSLPAFDSGEAPENVVASSIKSNKFAIESACVLVSKLNPRIPRIWNLPKLSDQVALASTEFVVLVPQGLNTSTLWAALNTPAFFDEMRGKVAGTSGSHQRVKPQDILDAKIPDPRALDPLGRDMIDNLGLTEICVRAVNRQLARTRDELLPLLMNGKITVKDAEAVVSDAV